MNIPGLFFGWNQFLYNNSLLFWVDIIIDWQEDTSLLLLSENLSLPFFFFYYSLEESDQLCITLLTQMIYVIKISCQFSAVQNGLNKIPSL